jgi:NMT1/THI5 like
MVRTLEFDVSEMAITTYLTAKAHGKAFTALPVFVMRQFHHSPILYNVKSGVKSPKDLEGKKVGVRAYTVTTGVWARGILASEYGVDLSKVTWVVVDEEHVQEYQKPANVEERPKANLGEMLAKGELAAAIGAGAVDSPDVLPLFVSPREAEADWYRKTGIYPRRACSVPSKTPRRCFSSSSPRVRRWPPTRRPSRSAGASSATTRCRTASRRIARRWKPSSSTPATRRFCRAR